MKLISFPQAVIFEVFGKDARRYLNARLTCDVKNLSLTAHTQGAMLSSTGKCLGIFDCLCLESDRFLLITPGGEADKLSKNLLQFKVADRLDLLNKSDEFSLYHVNESLNLSAVSYLRVRGIPQGRDYLISKDNLSKFFELNEDVQNITLDEFNLIRVKSNLPEFAFDLDENILINEINIDNFVSFDKGCYIGQEVVERLEAMGKTSYKILPVQINFDTGKEISEKEIFYLDQKGFKNKIGTVLSYYKETESKYLGFVRIKNNPEIFVNEILLQDGKLNFITTN